MDPVVQQEIHLAIQQSNQEMLQNMSEILDRKMTSFKRSAEEASQQQLNELKKIKSTQSLDFKKKANKDQYCHNAAVLQSMEDSKDNLGKQNYDAALSNLQEGISLVENRQKLVLIADQSPYGWLTVQNYKSNALAADDEDEKRLNRAENKAGQESRRRNAVRRAKFDFKKRQNPSSDNSSTSTASQSQASVQRRPGSCFACGKPGHWRSECQMVKQAQNQVNRFPIDYSEVSDDDIFDDFVFEEDL